MEIPVWNRTKIIATLGPACQAPEVLLSLIESGVDVCRLNCSHGSHESLQGLIEQVRTFNRTHKFNIPILLDLQGPKIRIGKLAEPYPVKPGDTIELCTTLTERQANRLPMELDTLARDVRPGDMVLVEDGKVELRALTTNGIDTVTLVVVSGTEIGSRKGVNLPNTAISLPSLTEKDLKDVEFGIKQQVEWIALSFVRRVEDVRALRQILVQGQSDARIIAKIEKPEALQNIDAIIAESDAIMVARGDLGVEIPIEEVPFWQKKIVAKCNALAKPVIVATQMLDSMIENKRPTRAEATDVANAVLDGADALMLSGETSTGKYPIETVRTMQRIITQAEQNQDLYHRINTADPASPLYIHDTMCVGACILARKLNAKALIGMTRSGYTAFQLARCRPQAPIFIFTDNIPLLNTLNLVWGVRAMYYDSFVGTNETINDVINILKTAGHIKVGDIVINLASMPLQARKRTNMIKMTIVE